MLFLGEGGHCSAAGWEFGIREKGFGFQRQRSTLSNVGGNSLPCNTLPDFSEAPRLLIGSVGLLIGGCPVGVFGG